LTYCVPYVVCTYGAVSYQMSKAHVALERRARAMIAAVASGDAAIELIGRRRPLA
jgi:hypothetical protein